MILPEAPRRKVTIDGNTAAAHVAHATNEVIVIYPITPSSPMGETADDKTAAHEKNLWGTVPSVTEMQSEAGAAGAVHGALTTGALTTTFTASQGLLLMIPNMYKIAGELTPCVFHVAARALAAQGLSIFGDHQDVMAARATGWAMLCSNNVQEAMDFALVAQAATLEARVPFMHFFDGFRTSHEIQKVEELTADDMRALLREEDLLAHRARGLTPERPVIRGTAQNPDVYFQGRETVNPFIDAVPGIVQRAFDQLAERTGRRYRLFDYYGAPDADRVLVLMGSGAETVEEVVDHMSAQGEKVGVLKVRLYRPFDVAAFVEALPRGVRKIAVLDRTKEPGASGEPLYLDVQSAVFEAVMSGRMDRADLPQIVGGRYGLGSKEFNPGMVKAVFDNLSANQPKNHFTIGIHDDMGHTSLAWDDHYETEREGVHRALFYGLGSDGTVGANKNSIKIIGKGTDFHAQGYFVYDSKKSGSMTISHLRFSPHPIKSTYLIDRADFVACHTFAFLERFDILDHLRPGGTFLVNSPYPAEEIWQHLPSHVRAELLAKEARFYVIDAGALAKSLGLGGRINVIMQAAFFAISGVLPEEKAMALIEGAVRSTYGGKGSQIVEMNIRAARLAKERLRLIALPAGIDGTPAPLRAPVPDDAPEFVRSVIGPMIAMRGDALPVSAIPADGTWPVGTTQYEKRNIAADIPIWEPDLCVQCNQCAFVCPHATIRVKLYHQSELERAPEGFKSMPVRGKGNEELRYTVQVAPEDCTGCGACVHICPAFEKGPSGAKTSKRAINMAPQAPVRDVEVRAWDHFLAIPDTDPKLFGRFTTKGSQFAPPLMEFSGACAGCGETPYIKLLTQLFGDRTLIANATGCSSIYGGNLPTTPYTTRADGRGPAWSNSLFEDAAEFGMGMRLTSDKLHIHARELLEQCGEDDVTRDLLELTAGGRTDDDTIAAVRARAGDLRTKLAGIDSPAARRMRSMLDHLMPRSVWVIGGDGWAYDIGFGGLDHVLASGLDINVLVLDTGVYSNTGGQSSKATPRAAVAKFAASGKQMPKKDLGAIAISYGNIYVAQIAYGSSMPQTVKAFQEAEAYKGPSLIIAYSHCIAHGIDMTRGTDTQKEAVDSGFWPLFRFNPMRRDEGKNPFELDSKPPSVDVETFLYHQNRFRMLRQSDPARAEALLGAARGDIEARLTFYRQLAGQGS
jgi:pyruvate-ferredoxin/flavodoxin oxidoreductase